MAGGLFALLDDIATLAKAAASSLDDVAAGALKASAKSAGVVIDDTAVTPQYVQGLSPARELPVIWRIARGSLINKFAIIIPAAMLLSTFAPQVLPWLLLAGGTYLSYEGAHKVIAWLRIGSHGSHDAHHEEPSPAEGSEDVSIRASSSNEQIIAEAEQALARADANEAHDQAASMQENQIVRGAITTDLVLSTEIMLIAMDGIDEPNVISRLLMLVLIALAMTALVYGVVAVLVKLDDVGLKMARSRSEGVAGLGYRLAASMPTVFQIISVIGTVAMLWVGGHLVAKSFAEIGFHLPYDTVHAFAHFGERLGGFGAWLGDTFASFLVGLIWGGIAYAMVAVLSPAIARLRTGKQHTKR